MPNNLHVGLSHGGLGLLATIGSIILIDIVLSGDNALVIGAAASRLPRRLRFLAILWGGAGAIVLRIVLAGAATLLLLVPLLQAVGGIVLMGIAIHLLLPQGGPRIRAHDRFLPAVATILVADATMSLDNVIAIGALAKGDVTVLAIGLVVSMMVLFLASAIIARIIERLSILLDLASLVLAYTAANLVVADPLVGPRITPALHRFSAGPFPGTLLLNVAFVAVVLLIDLGLRLRRAPPAAVAAAPGVARMRSGAAARIHTEDLDLRMSAQRAADLDGAGLNGAALDNPSLAVIADDPLERSQVAPGLPRDPVASRPLAASDAGDTLAAD